MNTISAPEGDSVISQILAAYELPGTILDIARHGKGHINDTFCVSCRTPKGGTVQLILQGLSQAAFPHPEEVMENFVGITSYLRREILAEGGDPSRETLSLVKTRDGADFVTDNRGRVWRLMPFIENADCYQSATPELFYENGRPLPFVDAVLSGHSTGAPGAVPMLALAQKQHGVLPWAELFGDAEKLAQDGFVVSPRLAGMINGNAPQAKTRWATAYFTKADGTRYVAGDVLKNPAYAETVRSLAREAMVSASPGACGPTSAWPNALWTPPKPDRPIRALIRCSACARPGTIRAAWPGTARTVWPAVCSVWSVWPV